MIFNILAVITYILCIILLAFTLFTAIRKEIKFRTREKELDMMLDKLKEDIYESENHDKE